MESASSLVSRFTSTKGGVFFSCFFVALVMGIGAHVRLGTLSSRGKRIAVLFFSCDIVFGTSTFRIIFAGALRFFLQMLIACDKAWCSGPVST